MAMLNGCRQHGSVVLLRDKDGEEGAPEALRTRCVFQVDGKHILRAQVIKLSEVANI